jgi:AraC family transcriptional activator of pobA
MKNLDVNFDNFVTSLPFAKHQNRNLPAPKPAFEASYLEYFQSPLIAGKVKPEILTAFEVVWIKRGSGSFMVDLVSHDIMDDTLYCLFPGQLYFFNPNAEIEGYRISFSDEFLCMADGQSCLPFTMDYQSRQQNVQVMRVNADVQVEIEDIVRTMIWECGNNFEFKTEILKGLLKIFIAYFSRRFEVSESITVQKKDSVIFGKFMRLLDKHFITKKSVADYAHELAVTSNYLSEVVKKVSGYAASHHIHQRIILEAKRAAFFSEANMKEISYQLGFEDASQFSKFFKNKTGVNFSEFKKCLLVG